LTGAASASLDTDQIEENVGGDDMEDQIMEEDGEDSDYGSEPAHASSNRQANAINQSGRRGGARPRRKRYAHLQKKKKRYRPPVNIEAGSQICVEVCRTRTLADAEWQDGILTTNVLSTEFHPVMHLDELEFFPGDFVIDKRDKGDS